ncbi:MAG: hypothetical protein V4717_15300 [Bacteroidota bacterium]
MHSYLKYLLLILLAVALAYVSCKKEYSCENCLVRNQPPIANAGSDTSIVLPVDSILLDGTLSFDADDGIASYKWIKIAGPDTFYIINDSHVTSSVNQLVKAIYHFELTVTDKSGLSSKDTVQVAVYSPGTTNRPPVAKAGSDTTIILPVNSMMLDGSNSSDPDNNISSYAWTKIAGPSAFNITSNNSVQAQVINLSEGVYQFELKVTDAGGLFSKDTVSVTVKNSIEISCGFQKTLIGKLSVYRYGFTTAVSGNKIVFAAGWELSSTVGSIPSSRVDIYDMVTQKWSIADLDDHAGHVAVISAGDRMFFAGGSPVSNQNTNATSKVDIYNTSTNTWTKAALSEARNGLRVAKAGNKVLFAGGINASGQSSSRVDLYDLISGAWSSAKLSQPSTDFAAALGNKAVFGVGTNAVDIYDASLNSWSTVSFMNAQFGMSVTALSGKLYLAGGYSLVNNNADYVVSKVVHIYDVVTNNWTTTNMSQPRAEMSTVGAGSKILWAGGTDSISSNVNGDHMRSIYNIEIYDINSRQHAHHSFTSYALTPEAVIIGKSALFHSSQNELHVYNFNSDTWNVCAIDLGGAPTFTEAQNNLYVAGPVGSSNDNVSVWKLSF